MTSSSHNSRHKDLRLPQALKKLPQWVCWKWEERLGKPGKLAKIPYDPYYGTRACTDDVFS